ncbi:MAG: questin oxidase family protein [Stellaceae bacterium]
MSAPLYISLDEALELIAPYGMSLKNGNSNHAPMVAEALCAMGRPEAVLPWIERYQERMAPRPPAAERIADDSWHEALGRRERFGDWSAYFSEELQQAAWREILDRWVGRLAAGFCAAATHGPIRVGHAVRALAECETPARRRELADALAGWATAWQTLPGARTNSETALPRDAIARIPLVPPNHRKRGNIVSALGALEAFPAFAAAIGLIDIGGLIAPLVAGLTETFARVYLANAHDVPTTIAFIHGVTSEAAVGNIVPHIGEATARIALRYAWQAGCGLYACFGRTPAAADEVDTPDISEADLVARALANGDEHLIKFTEACLTRHRLLPSPAYPAAALHAGAIIDRIGR